MSDDMLTITTADYTGSLNRLVHTGSGSPCTTSGFQPTNAQKWTNTFERFLSLREPMILFIIFATNIKSKSDQAFIKQRTTQVSNTRFVNWENLQNCNLNAFIGRRHGGDGVRQYPLMLLDPVGNLTNTIKRTLKSKGIVQSLEDAGRINSTMGQNEGNKKSKQQNLQDKRKCKLEAALNMEPHWQQIDT